QVAQARRVGRGDVDGEVAHYRRAGLDQPHIVGTAVLRRLVGADVEPDDAATLRPRGEARQHGGLALAVEAEAVDHRLVGVESEQARPRITDLRARRYGPDLDEAETHTQQRVRHLGVLVETGRDADRVGKAQAEGAHRQSRVVFARLG